SSPSDLQPVFDAMAESAARLCEAFDAAIFRLEADRLCLVAHHGPIPYGRVGEFSIPVIRGMVGGRALLEGRPVQVEDLLAAVDEYPEGSETARQWGLRTMLAVPLTRDGVAIGAIALRRTEVQLFNERQIGLLQTFADQAVIAIENARLLTELQTKNADLTEALQRQAATAEILRVISRSPTDVQPVFDAVATSATRLCDAFDATIFRVDTNGLRVVAHEGPIPAHPVGQGPPLVRGTPPGRAVLDRQTIHLADAQNESDEYPVGSALARRFGHRTTLSVPMLRGGDAIGVINV